MDVRIIAKEITAGEEGNTKVANHSNIKRSLRGKGR